MASSQARIVYEAPLSSDNESRQSSEASPAPSRASSASTSSSRRSRRGSADSQRHGSVVVVHNNDRKRKEKEPEEVPARNKKKNLPETSRRHLLTPPPLPIRPRVVPPLASPKRPCPKGISPEPRDWHLMRQRWLKASSDCSSAELRLKEETRRRQELEKELKELKEHLRKKDGRTRDCGLCTGPHRTKLCPKLWTSALAELRSWSSRTTPCRRCLEVGHPIARCCERPAECVFCGRNEHHSALCYQRPSPGGAASSSGGGDVGRFPQ